MGPKNMRHYKGSGSYFIVDKCQKDTNFDYEDAYYHYDIDIDRIHYTKKMAMNILLGIMIKIKKTLCHSN